MMSTRPFYYTVYMVYGPYLTFLFLLLILFTLPIFKVKWITILILKWVMYF